METFEITTIVGASLVEAIDKLCIGTIEINSIGCYQIDNIDRIIWYYYDEEFISISYNYKRIKSLYNNLNGALAV